MKYSRLTKEQFSELHKDFIDFLSVNTITESDWRHLKDSNDKRVDELLDIFSDIVWKKVLSKINYIENISKNHIYLFNFTEIHIKFIAIYVENLDIDFKTNNGISWLRENLMSESVKIYNSQKKYSSDRNDDKFDLIIKGGVITNGALFKYFDQIIE